jgi:hypothetical protein
MTKIGAMGVVLVFGGLSVGCGHFRVVKDRYQQTKSVAIVQFVGEPAKDLTPPFDLNNLTGPSPYERLATNDAIALQDFLKTRGFKVLPLDEMVQSDKYNAKGDNVPNGYFTPKGMRLFTARYNVGQGDISFMTANALAKELGVDAVVVVHSLWKAESTGLGINKVARTIVRVQMVDKMSSQIWEDQDFSDSAKATETMGFKHGNTEDFIAAYNEEFHTTLTKMQGRLDEGLR